MDDFPTSSELVARLEMIPAIKEWIDATQQYALALLTQGKSIPGWKAVRGRKHVVWTEDITPEILTLIGVEHVLTTPSLATPSQVLKKIQDNQLKNYVRNALTFQPVGAAQLAEKADKRPAFFHNASDDFDNLLE